MKGFADDGGVLKDTPGQREANNVIALPQAAKNNFRQCRQLRARFDQDVVCVRISRFGSGQDDVKESGELRRW